MGGDVATRHSASGVAAVGHGTAADQMQGDSRHGRRTSGFAWCPFEASWEQFRGFWRVTRLGDTGARSVVQENRRVLVAMSAWGDAVRQEARRALHRGPCTGS